MPPNVVPFLTLNAKPLKARPLRAGFGSIASSTPGHFAEDFQKVDLSPETPISLNQGIYLKSY